MRINLRWGGMLAFAAMMMLALGVGCTMSLPVESSPNVGGGDAVQADPVESVEQPDDAMDVSETAPVVEESSPIVDAEAVSTAIPETVPPLAAVSEDYTLVGLTGRPQFIYTFADW